MFRPKNTRYFLVDPESKGLRLLGGVGIKEESTDHDTPGGGYRWAGRGSKRLRLIAFYHRGFFFLETLLAGEGAPQKKGAKRRYSSQKDFAKMMKRQKQAI